MGSAEDSTDSDEPSDANSASARSSPTRLSRWLSDVRVRRTMYRAEPSVMLEELDEKENQTGKLPAGESVHLAGLCLTELYLPSSIDSLRRGIDRMGWRKGKTNDEDVVDWIDRARTSSGSWRSLGFVASSRNPPFMAERTAILPPGIHAIFPSLHASSGLSALTVLFVLDEDVSEDINEVLSRDFKRWSEDIPPHYVFGSSPRSKLSLLFLEGQLPHWLFSHSQRIRLPGSTARERSGPSLQPSLGLF